MTDSDITSYNPSPSDQSLKQGVDLSGSLGDFIVHFWGVRGSIPTPGTDTVRYGGNTPCVEVLVNGQRIIFDGGTGLRVLGKNLLHQEPQTEAHIFFTHTHWDRIQGFPFFLPAFEAKNNFFIYGSTALNGASIKQRLSEQMLQPNFFTPLHQMQSVMEFKDISAGSVIQIGDILVETIGLNQRTTALGYRITWNDRSLVYATDTDHTHASPDANLQYLAVGADVLIIDGTYADHEYHNSGCCEFVPWQISVELAKTANVKELIMFHHNPCHDDDYLDHLEVEIRSYFPNVRLAREGMILQLS